MKQLLALLVASSVLAGIALAQQRPATARKRPTIAKKSKPTNLAAPPAKWEQSVLDVFFVDARQELGPRPTAIVAKPAAAPVAESAAQGSSWSAIVSAEALEDQVKSIAPLLAQDAQSPARFKAAGREQAQQHLSQLAAVFAIIGQYDGEVRWKPSAATTAARLLQAAAACERQADTALADVTNESQQLSDLIRGGATASGGDSRASALVPRAALMRWLEELHEQRVAGATGDAKSFRRAAEQLARDAEMMAALGRLIQREGYEFADDKGYAQHARQLEQHARELREAARLGDFNAAKEAASGVTQSCERCHADFRG